MDWFFFIHKLKPVDNDKTTWSDFFFNNSYDVIHANNIRTTNITNIWLGMIWLKVDTNSLLKFALKHSQQKLQGLPDPLAWDTKPAADVDLPRPGLTATKTDPANLANKAPQRDS